jgi:hypothetical protein
MVVEDTPRISTADLRNLPSWPRMRARGVANVNLDIGGRIVPVRIELVHDVATFGLRSWLRCPSCGSRRRHLFLRDADMGCRRCFGLLYHEQAIPRSRWKREVAVPVLRAVHRCKGIGRRRGGG